MIFITFMPNQSKIHPWMSPVQPTAAALLSPGAMHPWVASRPKRTLWNSCTLATNRCEGMMEVRVILTLNWSSTIPHLRWSLWERCKVDELWWLAMKGDVHHWDSLRGQCWVHQEWLNARSFLQIAVNFVISPWSWEGEICIIMPVGGKAVGISHTRGI